MVNKAKGKSNPFKVNQVRSIKMKNKAKSVSAGLKKLSALSKTKVETLDEKMKQFQGVVRTVTNRTCPEEPTGQSEQAKFSREERIKAIADTENKTNEAFEKFTSLDI